MFYFEIEALGHGQNFKLAYNKILTNPKLNFSIEWWSYKDTVYEYKPTVLIDFDEKTALSTKVKATHFVIGRVVCQT